MLSASRHSSRAKARHLERLRHFYFERRRDARIIYLKIDDDFCFLGKDALGDLLEFRVAHPDYFFVMPPTVNSMLQSHIAQTSIVRGLSKADGDPYYPIPRPENTALCKQHQKLAQAKEPPLRGPPGDLQIPQHGSDQCVAQALAMCRKISTAAR